MARALGKPTKHAVEKLKLVIRMRAASVGPLSSRAPKITARQPSRAWAATATTMPQKTPLLIRILTTKSYFYDAKVCIQDQTRRPSQGSRVAPGLRTIESIAPP